MCLSNGKTASYIPVREYIHKIKDPSICHSRVVFQIYHVKSVLYSLQDVNLKDGLVVDKIFLYLIFDVKLTQNRTCQYNSFYQLH